MKILKENCFIKNMNKLMLVIFLLSAMFAAAQSNITVTFRAENSDGTSQRLDTVKITDETQGWSQTLVYPDITMTLDYEDGIEEPLSTGGLSHNFPNPFSGSTEMVLSLEKDEQTCIRIVGMDGKILVERNIILPQGEHRINVSLDKPQLALIHVTTAHHSYTIKMLNIGEGSSNNIEVYDLPEKISKNTKSSDEWAFALGDVMSYTGVTVLDEDNVITSNTVTQALYHDDTITLVFDAVIPEDPQLPTVVTSEVGDITYTTAVCGGEVVNDGGAEVTERGVCWSTDSNPTISDSHISNGAGLGMFESNIENLVDGTTYYVRAYATNSVGTSYGEMRTFTTEVFQLPRLITSSISNITATTATCGGYVISSGSSEVTERGVCWSTVSNPTINDSHISNGAGLGSFEVNIDNLIEGTTYYVRAYAISNVGTAYGNSVHFIAGNDNSQVPTGAVNGLFSVSETQKIMFSKGNLQYNAVQGTHATVDGEIAQGTWRFAENQWDYVGEDNTNVSETYDGWIDLFGWGTSGWNSGAVCYQPWSISQTNSQYYPGGNYTNNLTGDCAYADWGVYNAISNGGNLPGTWRTLTHEEWEYLTYDRATNSGIRFVMARVNGINGVVLLPDDWDASIYALVTISQYNTSFSNNVIDEDTWVNTLEANGAVFLPAAGRRASVTSDFFASSEGCYWSTTRDYRFNAWDATLNDGGFVSSSTNRYHGESVRLVRDFPDQNDLRPAVTTNPVTEVSYTTAICGGEVIAEGGTEVTERGVCWSISFNPTINDSHTIDGMGLGMFESNIDGLVDGVTYYVRAYATNSAGTSYGERRTFTTETFQLPGIITSNISNITATTATCGGNVISNGSLEVIERGVCWSTNPNPTINYNHKANGAGLGSFEVNIDNLIEGTTYYVRAYATSDVGTAYGNRVQFIAGNDNSQVPAGAINGLFSVSETQKIMFSKGNLQYNAAQGTHSTIDGGTAQGTWRFAENQWDFVGNDNANISETYDGWIDFFGWSTSGWNNGSSCYQPWVYAQYGDYYSNSNPSYGLTGIGANADWGVYNAISNGGNEPGLWRTLTHEEWVYLLYNRTTYSGIRYVMAQVDSIKGIILLPDEWDTLTYTLDNSGSDFSDNVIDTDTWEVFLEEYGAVFLPAAGYRREMSIVGIGNCGYYWSASAGDGYDSAWEISFTNYGLNMDSCGRFYGNSVRLVINAN